MRTTLALDDDVLAAAKELASSQRVSIGEVVSSLMRRALQPPTAERLTRNGLPLLPLSQSSGRVTSELVKEIDQELP